MKFHFSKFWDRPYSRDLEDEQGKTIVGLAAIFYGTPIEDQEEVPSIIESNEEKELGEYLDPVTIIHYPLNE